MKNLILSMSLCLLAWFSLTAAPVAAEKKDKAATVVGKWANPVMEGISFEFRENKTGVMIAFGIDGRFVWEPKENKILIHFPPEKEIHTLVLDKDGKKLHYFGKKETPTPEFSMQRVK